MQSHCHIFVELESARKRGGYFKLVDGAYDQSRAYTMLYCETCGETKEVVCANHSEPSLRLSEIANNL